MSQNRALNEEMIAAWMRMISAVENRRIVEGLSFNEALVCNLLQRQEGVYLTASQLCAATHILKSQMNGILRSLEAKEVISRAPSPVDRRVTEIRLKNGGGPLWRSSHAYTLSLMDRLIQAMGPEKIQDLLPLLTMAADKLDELSMEVQ